MKLLAASFILIASPAFAASELPSAGYVQNLCGEYREAKNISGYVNPIYKYLTVTAGREARSFNLGTVSSYDFQVGKVYCVSGWVSATTIQNEESGPSYSIQVDRARPAQVDY